MTATQNGRSFVMKLRDLFAMVREGAVVAVIAMVLFWPSHFQGILKSAGVTEVAGVKFDWDRVAEASDEAMQSQEKVADLTQELEKLRERLERVSERSPSPEFRELSADVARLHDKAEDAGEAVRRSVEVHSRLLQQAPPEARVSKERIEELRRKVRNSPPRR